MQVEFNGNLIDFGLSRPLEPLFRESLRLLESLQSESM